MKRKMSPAFVWTGSLWALLACSQAWGVELIANGGFETGTFASWTVTDLAGGSGSWFIDDNDGFTPFSGLSTVGPSGGSFYAVSDQTGPGTHALEQTFTVPGPASSVILSYDMFVNDFDGGPIFDPNGLDHNSIPNQHGRVDLMTSVAGAFDTGAGVISNFYAGVDPQATIPNNYIPYVFDITGLVGAGGTFKIRFAEVDNQGNFNQGVDNVSIDFTPVPEPTSMVLAVVAGLALLRRKRIAKR